MLFVGSGRPATPWGAAAVDGLPHPDVSTPLQGACECGHREVARCLLEAGAAVNGVEPEGPAPLQTAAAHGHVAVMQPGRTGKPPELAHWVG